MSEGFRAGKRASHFEESMEVEMSTPVSTVLVSVHPGLAEISCDEAASIQGGVGHLFYAGFVLGGAMAVGADYIDKGGEYWGEKFWDWYYDV